MGQVREGSTKELQQSLEPRKGLVLSQSAGEWPPANTTHPTFNIQVPVLEKIHSFPRTDRPVSTPPSLMLFLGLCFNSFTICKYPVYKEIL